MSALNANDSAARSARRDGDRIRLSYEHVQSLAIAGDIIVIVLASMISGYAYHAIAFESVGDSVQYAAFGLLMALSFAVISQMRSMYNGENLVDIYRQILHICVASPLSFLFLTSIAFALKISELISRGYVFTFFFFAFGSLIVSRVAWQKFLRSSLDGGLFVQRSIIAIGDDSEHSDVTFEKLQRYGHVPACKFAIPAGDISEQYIQQLIRQISAAVRQSSVDEIVIAASMNRLGMVVHVVEALRCLPLPVRFAVGDAYSDVISRPCHKLGDLLSYQVQRHPLHLWERLLKRSFDVSIALVALVVLSVTMLATAALIKATSPGPVLFRQMRFGANGRPFEILKFRSMTVESQSAEFRQASRNDSRVTWVGRFIRRSSIDELPQLWNVLRGEMSIVGPRPHAVAHDEAYEDLISRYAMRRFMKPGLTGWAQVNGSRGETPTVESMALRIQHDLWYIDNWSLWLDTLIVIRTAITLCRPKDVY